MQLQSCQEKLKTLAKHNLTLFDIGALHSFVSMSIVSMLGLTHVPLDMPLHVKSPLGDFAKLELVCKSFPLLIGNKEFFVDCACKQSFDVILDVNWLQLNHVVIDFMR